MVNIASELISKAPFSQESIAEYLGCDQSTISKWKSGERKIPAEQFERLCHLVGYSLADYAMGKPFTPSRVGHFRSNGILKEDLEAIADINRMLSNIALMERIANDKK